MSVYPESIFDLWVLRLSDSVSVGRELRMIKLKKEVNALLGELGRSLQYKSAMEETDNKVTSPGNVL